MAAPQLERKLTYEQREEIIFLLRSGEKQHYLAMKFGVRQPAISYYYRYYVLNKEQEVQVSDTTKV